MSRSLLCYVFIYICVCTMLRYYFMSLYICVYYVKRVNMSRSLLFHVFIAIYVCVYYVKSVNSYVKESRFIYMCVL